MNALWLLLPTGQRASGEWIDDTLRARVVEKGLLARTPRAGEFPRQRVELIRDADPVSAVNRLFRERGWTDGLPIVPPTLARVDEMLGASPLERHIVLGEVEPLGGVASVEKVAANAVMAGCDPPHFPVVLAAVQAMLDPAFNLRGVQTTDENVAPLLVVNGPVARRIGVNAGWGALGPGWPANAAIGRAARLVMN
ncbi:MAG: TlpA family protein disulfide reductase, partial [Candidatus Rokuibacteriota bacterium]